jgi:hypothetical protein
LLLIAAVPKHSAGQLYDFQIIGSTPANRRPLGLAKKNQLMSDGQMFAVAQVRVARVPRPGASASAHPPNHQITRSPIS